MQNWGKNSQNWGIKKFGIQVKLVFFIIISPTRKKLMWLPKYANVGQIYVVIIFKKY
jgi:hypothetical protein